MIPVFRSFLAQHDPEVRGLRERGLNSTGVCDVKSAGEYSYRLTVCLDHISQLMWHACPNDLSCPNMHACPPVADIHLLYLTRRSFATSRFFVVSVSEVYKMRVISSLGLTWVFFFETHDPTGYRCVSFACTHTYTQSPLLSGQGWEWI